MLSKLGFLTQSLDFNSLLLDARRCNTPVSRTDYQSGEAGCNGGNSKPDRESLQAEMGMGKDI